MENFKSQIDLFLTEISIELLGNKIYDINGKRQDKLINCMKALPEDHRESSHKNENSNDFLCSLGYQSDFTDNETCSKEFLNDQFDFILKDANKTPKVNQEIIQFLSEYKSDQAKLVMDISEMNIRKIVGKYLAMIEIIKKSSLDDPRWKFLKFNDFITRRKRKIDDSLEPITSENFKPKAIKFWEKWVHKVAANIDNSSELNKTFYSFDFERFLWAREKRFA